MIDISKLSYRVYLLRETGEQLDITNLSENLSWEENDGELAMRVSLSLANVMYNGQLISSVVKPNCQMIVMAQVESDVREVARARITKWEPTRSGSEDKLSVSGYDELFDLQHSQDNRYISAGTSTSSAIMSVLSDWGVPVGEFNAPGNANAKLTYKNEYLADIILDLLNTAVEHGEKERVIRADKGKVSVVLLGGNSTVYKFEEERNLSTSRYSLDTDDMITVVKIVAPEDDEKRQKVEAVINGRTEYGRRQRIYVRDKEDTLAAAENAARKILEEKGKPKETFSVKAPDVPYIRKGDVVSIKCRVFEGNALVSSIQHDADSRSMTMDLLPQR